MRRSGVLTFSSSLSSEAPVWPLCLWTICKNNEILSRFIRKEKWNIYVVVTHVLITCSHVGWWYLLAEWCVLVDQVTPSPQLHQFEGPRLLPAVDPLCVLSLFHTAGFIGKAAGFVEGWQLLCLHVSRSGSVCNDLLIQRWWKVTYL